MAIIRRGSIEDFSVSFAEAVPAVSGLKTLSVLREARRDAQAQGGPMRFEVSGSPRGLTLKSIKLTRGFEGVLGNLFKKTNLVYFLAWCWDFSPQDPNKPRIYMYPGLAAKKDSCIIPLKVRGVREFLGAGVLLFPQQKVSSGIAVRIQIWEKDGGVRRFGELMTEVAQVIQESDLRMLLSQIGVAVPIIAIVNESIRLASALAGVIGNILKANSDDYVDFYEGYYPVSEPWTPKQEINKGYASEITLTKI